MSCIARTLGAPDSVPAGKTERSASSASSSGLSRALDVRHEMEDVAVALDLHVLADGHGPRPRDPSEVVAAEVDEHHVLGSFLGVALELLGEQRVLAIVRAARTGPGDGVGGELVALDLEEQLRRCADDLEAGGPDEEQVRARVDPPQGAVEPDPVERRPGRGVVREVERLAPREHDLDRLAGRDGVLGDLDGVDVLVAPEARADGAAERPRLRRAPAGGRPPRDPLAPDSPLPDAERAPDPAISAALGRALRSRASKIASSAIR